jgi:predicted neuraminidase
VRCPSSISPTPTIRTKLAAISYGRTLARSEIVWKHSVESSSVRRCQWGLYLAGHPHGTQQSLIRRYVCRRNLWLFDRHGNRVVAARVCVTVSRQSITQTNAQPLRLRRYDTAWQKRPVRGHLVAVRRPHAGRDDDVDRRPTISHGRSQFQSDH